MTIEVNYTVRGLGGQKILETTDEKEAKKAEKVVAATFQLRDIITAGLPESHGIEDTVLNEIVLTLVKGKTEVLGLLKSFRGKGIGLDDDEDDDGGDTNHDGAGLEGAQNGDNPPLDGAGDALPLDGSGESQHPAVEGAEPPVALVGDGAEPPAADTHTETGAEVGKKKRSEPKHKPEGEGEGEGE